MAHLGLFWKEQKKTKHEQLKPGFFDLSHQIDWGLFALPLEEALGRCDLDPRKGGRPPYRVLVMFKILVLQKLHE